MRHSVTPFHLWTSRDSPAMSCHELPARELCVRLACLNKGWYVPGVSVLLWPGLDTAWLGAEGSDKHAERWLQVQGANTNPAEV